MKNDRRQNNFNLIRLILALLVIFGHSPEFVDGDRHRELLTQIFGTVSFGEFAVDGFFLLSGYLIVQSWDSQPQAWQFLKKRMLRIYPGFIVASLIAAAVIGPLAANPASYFGAFDLAAFAQGVLFLSVPITPDVFSGTPYATLNGAVWTISKEFTCYLLVLVAGATGMLRIRQICLAITVSLFAVFVWHKIRNIPVVDLRLMSFFLSGACYYLYRDRIRYHGAFALIAIGIVGVLMFSWRGAEFGLATVGGYALLYLASKRSALLSHFNRLPDVSYGVYLYGWPIQKLMLWYYPSLSPWLLFAIAAPAAMLAGLGSWYLVEKPALRFKGTPISIPDDPEQKLASRCEKP